MSGWAVFKLLVLALFFLAALAFQAEWLSAVDPQIATDLAVSQFSKDAESATADLRRYNMAKAVLDVGVITLLFAIVLFAGDLCKAIDALFRR